MINRKIMQKAFDLLCDAVEPTATQIQADIGMCAQWDVDAIECIDTLRQALAQPEREPIQAINDVIDYLYSTGADNDMANRAHIALKQLQMNLRDQTALHLLYKSDYEDLRAQPEQEPVSELYSIEAHGNGYAIYCGRDWQHHGMNIGHLTEVTPTAIKLIKDALNQKTKQTEKQDPVAWMREDGTLLFADGNIFAVGQAFYTAPPKREFVGLTDEEVTAIEKTVLTRAQAVKVIEAKLREKNT